MKKMMRKIPQFKSYEEEAKFWSTHDTTDYWDDSEEIPIEKLEIDPALREQILQRAQTKKMISLRLEKQQIKYAKQIARKKRLPYQALLRAWIEEGIQNELAKYLITQFTAPPKAINTATKEKFAAHEKHFRENYSIQNSDRTQKSLEITTV